MIAALFETLNRALESTPLIALGAALLWGVVSILLSPCHLASIPLIVGFINDQGAMSAKRAFVLSALFSSGILLTIAAIGTVTAMMGRMMGDIGVWGTYGVAAVFMVVGLHLLGWLPLPFMSGASQPGVQKKGLLASFLLGLLFGVALGPCTFAFMAPVLAVTFSVASTHLWYAGVLLCAYGIGHCSVIILAGTFTEMVERYLEWNANSHGTVMLKKICGALIIMAGVYLVAAQV